MLFNKIKLSFIGFIVATLFVNKVVASPQADTTHQTVTHRATESAHVSSDEMSDVGAFILHHISDDYYWHIVGDISIPLPVILYNSDKGLSIFLSSAFHHGEHVVDGYKYEHGHIVREDGQPFLDFSITKNVFSLIISAILIILIFTAVAKGYKVNHNKAPKGIQSFLEPIILFVRDDIVKSSIGEKKYLKFLPYLLTLFFFIWINNLLGLIPIFPGGANVTGNISLTFTLAVFTLFLTNINGSKHYWLHILWPTDVPLPMRPIIALIELLGVFTKPFALMIRLFANISAGHIVILSIVSLIFVLTQTYQSVAVGYAVSVVSVMFSVFMNILELLVAALQAYIFTMLTALFIGQAVDEGHHAHHEEAHH